jgi:Xaa-Pro aminopeptidase
MLTPGTSGSIMRNWNIMTSELLALGLLDKVDVQNEDKDGQPTKYFMHGTSTIRSGHA